MVAAVPRCAGLACVTSRVNQRRDIKIVSTEPVAPTRMIALIILQKKQFQTFTPSNVHM